MSPKSVAPPPPPPPPPIDQSPTKNTTYKPMANGDVSNGSVKLITPQKLTQQKKILPTIDDTRNDLLKAIRDGKLESNIFYKNSQQQQQINFKKQNLFQFAGIKLRKVEKSEQKEKERSSAVHDVASILARRVAIELSESEDSDSDEDSECWVEQTETSA